MSSVRRLKLSQKIARRLCIDPFGFYRVAFVLDGVGGVSIGIFESSGIRD